MLFVMKEIQRNLILSKACECLHRYLNTIICGNNILQIPYMYVAFTRLNPLRLRLIFQGNVFSLYKHLVYFRAYLYNNV